jgi:hypothetical protein
MKSKQIGVIRADEAYSKLTVLELLGVSQKFWDKLLVVGLPFANVGHARWVSGRQLIEHLENHSTTKQAVAE